MFIAGEDLIGKVCDAAGGRVERIPFTSLWLRWVLLHRKKIADELRIAQRRVDVSTDGLITFIREHNVRRLCIVIDVGPTANQFVTDLSRRLSPHQVQFDVRDYWTREEADFYDRTPKLYVFSAPLLSLLKQSGSKYCLIDVSDVPPFETYGGAYVRAGNEG
ncbi:hypothetical protein [Bradyrhizobium genosp. P]|uniref:hypothetical protein n=1 Tax=Bradyrhizobium genosp. P TaxID=83641 RepID=UPI003CF00952